MKLSLNWLKDFIDIKNITPEKLADKLTMSGTAVDSIEYQADKYKNIIVGEILEITPHPNADKLQVVKVRFKIQDLRFKNIVCGAKNIKVGDKVPVALPGVILPNGLKIEKREVRGVKSEGMLCAEDELDLGDDHAGILILPAEATVGESIIKSLGLDDAILDLELTPNRGDCMSVLGVAREISVLTKSKINPESFLGKNQPRTQKVFWAGSKLQFKIKNYQNNALEVKVQDKNLCPKYCVQVIKNVKVGESPEWLKHRLSSVGIRPINNIVDITNYVMMEMGQPMHAFDLAKIKSQPRKLPGQNSKLTIYIRRAKKGEKIITIDDQERELDEEMLVITDCEKPIALAGVMGGAETQVSENTKDIILEAAIFDPISVRKTSRSLGLISEASLRFERQVDWQMTEIALRRATDLIVEIAGGQLKPAVVVKNLTPRAKKIKVSIEYLENLLGIKLGYRQIEKILINLGFKVKLLNCQIVKLSNSLSHKSKVNKTVKFEVLVPSWRNDITIPADIAEEFGRILDFNNFKPTNISGEIKPPIKNNLFYCENKIKDTFVSLGYSEVLNYTFVGEIDNSLTSQLIGGSNSQSIEIIKPLNSEQKYLRQSLIPQLLKTASRNLRFFHQIKIFESSRVFIPQKNQILPFEQRKIAGVLSVKNKTDYQLYKKLKGEIEILIHQINIKLPINYIKKDRQIFLKLKNNLYLGQIYLIDQKIKDNYKIRQNIIAFNLDLEILNKLASEQKKYTAIPLFPTIERDISFILRNKTYYQDIVNKLKSQNHLINNISLVDEHYLAQDQRSLTLRLTYISYERTLTSKEVANIEQKICSVLEKEFKAKIRR